MYVISGFCAALGGILYTFNAVQSGNPLHAIGMELDAIAAVAIGGTLLTGGYGFIIGSLLGVLVIGTISSIIRFSGTLNSGWTRIASGLLILGFIVMQRVITLGAIVVRDAAASARPPGMHDVARVAHVSHQTVSRVLNDHPHVRPATKERVRQAIAELGYRRNAAARSLVTRRSGVIGVLTPRTELYGPTSSMLAVEVAVREAGYFVSLASVADTSAAALGAAVDHFKDQAAEAVVLIAPERDWLAAARDRRSRHAGGDDVRRLPGCSAVTGDGCPRQPVGRTPRDGSPARPRPPRDRLRRRPVDIARSQRPTPRVA